MSAFSSGGNRFSRLWLIAASSVQTWPNVLSVMLFPGVLFSVDWVLNWSVFPLSVRVNSLLQLRRRQMGADPLIWSSSSSTKFTVFSLGLSWSLCSAQWPPLHFYKSCHCWFCSCTIWISSVRVVRASSQRQTWKAEVQVSAGPLYLWQQGSAD